MTNIFKRLFYTKNQCIILDFIDKNKDSVEYHSAPKFDDHDDLIGTIHYVSINVPVGTLKASLTKYKPRPFSYPQFRDSDAQYRFVCKETDNTGQEHAATARTISGDNDNFAYHVYLNMLNGYVRKHGCPCQR